MNRVAEVMGCPVESFLMKYLGLPPGGDPNDGFFRASVLKKIGQKIGKKLAELKKAAISIRVGSLQINLRCQAYQPMTFPYFGFPIAKKIKKLTRKILGWQQRSLN